MWEFLTRQRPFSEFKDWKQFKHAVCVLVGSTFQYFHSLQKHQQQNVLIQQFSTKFSVTEHTTKNSWWLFAKSSLSHRKMLGCWLQVPTCILINFVIVFSWLLMNDIRQKFVLCLLLVSFVDVCRKRPTFSEIVFRLNEVLVDSVIEDELGRKFWKEHFLQDKPVRWSEQIFSF